MTEEKTELAMRQEAAQTLEDSAKESAKAEDHEQKMMQLISAVDKGIVDKQYFENVITEQNKRINELEVRLLKAKAQGRVPVVVDQKQSDNERLRKLFPTLSQSGHFKD